jgi:hypothetical protein
LKQKACTTLQWCRANKRLFTANTIVSLHPSRAMPEKSFETILLGLVAVGIGHVILSNAAKEKAEAEEKELVEAGLAVLRAKRLRDDQHRDGARSKRQVIPWNHQRAKMCVSEDYLRSPGSPYPIFSDKMFQATFRVTRTIAEYLLQQLALQDPYFRLCSDATGKVGICPTVKLLMALKLLAFGCSPRAFQDYFQMGYTTGYDCLRHFCRCISSNQDIRATFLRRMSRADAHKVTQLHEAQHVLATEKRDS